MIKRDKKLEKKDSHIFNYLVTNKSFIDWVREPNDARQYFWKKWIEEHPENSNEILKAKKFIQSLKFEEKELSSSELDAVFGRIVKSNKTRSLSFLEKVVSIRFLHGNSLKIASAISLLILSSFLLYFYIYSDSKKELLTQAGSIEWMEVITGRGEQTKVVLPDGSVVNLNYESSLRYPSEFTDFSRSVELSGEAFFDVVHNKERPFKVSAGGFETRVLGTTFNVNSYVENPEIKISLVSGKIKVLQLDEKLMKMDSILLIPGEQMSFVKSSNEIFKGSFNVDGTIAWKDGVIVFNEVNFYQFIEKLEKWYDVNFQVFGPYPANWTFNGRYENEELEDILIGVQFVYDLDYSIQGNNIILKFK